MNTILKLESNVNSNVAEKILGHKNGLDGVYLAPTRQECFKEFCKGILQLTISDTERQKITIKKLQDDKTDLEQLKVEIKKQSVISAKNSEHNQSVIVGLVNDMQDKSDRQVELIKMINELQKQVAELKSR